MLSMFQSHHVRLWFLFTILTTSMTAAATLRADDMPTYPADQTFDLWTDAQLGNTESDNTEVYQPRGDGNGWVTKINRPTLAVYLPSKETNTGTSIIICPGGGYGGLSIEKEGHAVAQWMCDLGVTAGVLKYRCSGGANEHPVPLQDARRALEIMREHASQWELKPDRVGILGFSAGGHLAASVATDAEADINYAVLVYPVISMRNGVTHNGSKKNLLGKEPSDELIAEMSRDERVDAETCPTFLVHAGDDKAVPIENSLRYYAAMQKHNVPGELHIYDRGGHGFGMFRDDRPVDSWPNACKAWMQINGWIAPEEKADAHASSDATRASMDDNQPGWKPLTQDDFVHVNSNEDTWSWQDGVLHCTGRPVSVLRTAKEYRNFELVVEWMHEKPAGNSGCFVWTTPESIAKLTEAQKPGLPDGIEVQMLDHGYTDMIREQGKDTSWFGTNGDVFPVRVDMTPFPPLSPNGSRSFPRQHLAKGHGQWNQYYIRAINGEVRLWVNGEEVSGGTDIQPAEGYLCLESEGSPIQFRKLRIRELP
ncbi:pectin acetylesterase [Rhodopirellula sallentina SM41]|uniref:Pectin acetylesterase n=2 Tax=Rhodopirellula TaxID=265488 RepID=M5UKM3_9BACT|nr:pectin acetylesterase [Rhodopirellula sallentina SM41]